MGGEASASKRSICFKTRFIFFEHAKLFQVKAYAVRQGNGQALEGVEE